jgi:XRE family aerobic/anaerobic benzoate catabolism transcriptional regulator
VRDPASKGRQERLLRDLGSRVRARREELGLSRQEAAEAAGLSVRFLATLEGGTGNISVARLADLALALGTSPGRLLPASGLVAARPVVALLGLRGAGKSTIGRELGRHLRLPFLELDDLIEEAAGMATAPIFELHGERYFRRLEREALARLLAEGQPAILATGGGIVTEPETFDLLRRHATTVWLRARPVDHWQRVLAQGDRRPMANRAAAMAELEALLAAREPLYARADLAVETWRLGVGATVALVVEQLGRGLHPGRVPAAHP